MADQASTYWDTHPVAWALDGFAIFGYHDADGSTATRDGVCGAHAHELAENRATRQMKCTTPRIGAACARRWSYFQRTKPRRLTAALVDVAASGIKSRNAEKPTKMNLRLVTSA